MVTLTDPRKFFPSKVSHSMIQDTAKHYYLQATGFPWKLMIVRSCRDAPCLLSLLFLFLCFEFLSYMYVWSLHSHANFSCFLYILVLLFICWIIIMGGEQEWRGGWSQFWSNSSNAILSPCRGQQLLAITRVITNFKLSLRPLLSYRYHLYLLRGCTSTTIDHDFNRALALAWTS